MNSVPHEVPSGPRQALRQRLLSLRKDFAQSPAAVAASAALSRHLTELLEQLEPELLGLYWPQPSEFNAVALFTADSMSAKLAIAPSLALPFALRFPVQMHYRAWNGQTPPVTDECGIPSSSGAPVVPDVVLVPCVGFTSSGFRLGHGGGYFDRWLALHPDVTAVGVAWALGEIDEPTFAAQPHDLPLTLVVTERGIV